MPSIRPLATNWASRPDVHAREPKPHGRGTGHGEKHPATYSPGAEPRSATGSLRLPLAYSLSSQTTHLPSWTTYLVISGDRVLAVAVERDRADDRIVVLDVGERLGDRLAVGADRLDRVQEQVHAGEGEHRHRPRPARL